eukprot:CAMPEP_0114573988 /NCGR_PEP_ID=MMETSP0114-20121206/19160_1 /TAXON_ID=31324 /ORGANISM="Goniomonas sp, Strain m" /LENGTH=168 /DNA_ID=CAMNT_0001761385 /DNA_START=142 /DNA_END=647 /DNA_ORIENTATION=-
MQFVIKSGSDNASGQRGKLSGTTSPEPMSPVGGGHKTMADDVGNDDALDVSVWGRDRLARNFFLGGTLLQVRTLLGQGMEVGAGESWVPLHQLGVGDRRFKTKALLLNSCFCNGTASARGLRKTRQGIIVLAPNPSVVIPAVGHGYIMDVIVLAIASSSSSLMSSDPG